jgi:hypothetical protein
VAFSLWQVFLHSFRKSADFQLPSALWWRRSHSRPALAVRARSASADADGVVNAGLSQVEVREIVQGSALGNVGSHRIDLAANDGVLDLLGVEDLGRPLDVPLEGGVVLRRRWGWRTHADGNLVLVALVLGLLNVVEKHHEEDQVHERGNRPKRHVAKPLGLLHGRFLQLFLVLVFLRCLDVVACQGGLLFLRPPGRNHWRGSFEVAVSAYSNQ